MYGPILVSVIGLAATNPESAMIYMIAYILGFAIPFFVLSFFITKMSWIKRNSMAFMKVGGYIMIVMGVFLYFNWMTKIIVYFSSLFGGFTVLVLFCENVGNTNGKAYNESIFCI